MLKGQNGTESFALLFRNVLEEWFGFRIPGRANALRAMCLMATIALRTPAKAGKYGIIRQENVNVSGGKFTPTEHAYLHKLFAKVEEFGIPGLILASVLLESGIMENNVRIYPLVKIINYIIRIPTNVCAGKGLFGSKEKNLVLILPVQMAKCGMAMGALPLAALRIPTSMELNASIQTLKIVASLGNTLMEKNAFISLINALKE